MKKLLIIFTVLINTPAIALVNADIPGACSVNINTAIAVYEPYSFTCNAGYFLPADTLECKPCPTGFTCSGGTFDFNPDHSQGLTQTTQTTQNLSNTCSINFANAVAIFERATINLNFDDGNGNVTSTTCEYGDTIMIPENVPTRPGYVFTGWVVRENN